MSDLDSDQTAYRDLWVAVLEGVLLWPREKVDEWLGDVGMPLLTEHGTLVFHEEPWFWVCPEIAREFTTVDKYLSHEQEVQAAVWHVLSSDLRGCVELDGVDWELLRQRCRSACVLL